MFWDSAAGLMGQPYSRPLTDAQRDLLVNQVLFISLFESCFGLLLLLLLFQVGVCDDRVAARPIRRAHLERD